MDEEPLLRSLRQFIPSLPLVCLDSLPPSAHVVGEAAAWYLAGSPSRWQPTSITVVVDQPEVEDTTIGLLRAVADCPTIRCTAQWIHHRQASQFNLTISGTQCQIVIQGNPYCATQNGVCTYSIAEFVARNWAFSPEAVAVRLCDLKVDALDDMDKVLPNLAAYPDHVYKCRYSRTHEKPFQSLTHWTNLVGWVAWTITPECATRLAHLRMIGAVPVSANVCIELPE